MHQTPPSDRRLASLLHILDQSAKAYSAFRDMYHFWHELIEIFASLPGHSRMARCQGNEN